MTPDTAFRDARERLIRAYGDPDAAHAAFRWPELQAFNWVTHWFDEFARGNRTQALRVVSEAGVESVTFADMADRSRRVARYLRDAGVARGDRMLVMLTNVVPLWETVLAAIRLGPSSSRPRHSSPATTWTTGSRVATSGTSSPMGRAQPGLRTPSACE